MKKTVKKPVRKNASERAISDRQILGRFDLDTGDKFSPKKDWEEVKKYFKGKCVYCGAKEGNKVVLHKDHAIPINRRWLGMHRHGNIVPACQECNSDKSARNFAHFCRLQDKLGKQSKRGAEAEKDIREYMKYMRGIGYKKLRLGKNEEERKEIRKILDEAGKESGKLRDATVALLKEIVNT